MALQRLTLTLDGITAGDYMQWVRDPEPPALGLGLQSIEVRGDPLGDTIEAVLSWNVPPPRAIEAAPVAGLPLTPETIVVNSTPTSKNALRAVAHDFAETALLPGRSRVRQTHTVPRSASKAARFD